jgi:hypothetical protein
LNSCGYKNVSGCLDGAWLSIVHTSYLDLGAMAVGYDGGFGVLDINPAISSPSSSFIAADACVLKKKYQCVVKKNYQRVLNSQSHPLQHRLRNTGPAAVDVSLSQYHYVIQRARSAGQRVSIASEQPLPERHKLVRL